MKFVKMQGLGNDYVYVDTFETPIADPVSLSIKVSRPHFGVGSDGLILIGPSDKADASMRIFNADGSEAEMCGNGLRCTVRYLYESGRVPKERIAVETGAGLRYADVILKDGKFFGVKADMGEPILDAAKIPVTGDSNRVCVPIENGACLDFTCVSMGNPHAITFMDEIAEDWFLRNGPLVEKNEIFPMRTNAEFVQVLSRTHLRVFVWERGSGATLACGTAACATLVAAVLNGLAERTADVELPGGTLHIEWNESDNHVYMTGPAEVSFYGEWPDEV